jgi:hypothetical protein
MCQTCYRVNCAQVYKKKCKCGLEYNNKSCRSTHLENFCFKMKICNICNTLKPKDASKHVCINQKYCKNCKKAVKIDHQCFILTADQIEIRDTHIKNNKEKEFNGFVFFDFETYVCDQTGIHIVNLAISQRACIKCIDNKNRCDYCNKKIIHYNISEFVDWMLQEEQENYNFIAHNA